MSQRSIGVAIDFPKAVVPLQQSRLREVFRPFTTVDRERWVEEKVTRAKPVLIPGHLFTGEAVDFLVAGVPLCAQTGNAFWNGQVPGIRARLGVLPQNAADHTARLTVNDGWRDGNVVRLQGNDGNALEQ
jgi:hypothetical protein